MVIKNTFTIELGLCKFIINSRGVDALKLQNPLYHYYRLPFSVLWWTTASKWKFAKEAPSAWPSCGHAYLVFDFVFSPKLCSLRLKENKDRTYLALELVTSKEFIVGPKDLIPTYRSVSQTFLFSSKACLSERKLRHGFERLTRGQNPTFLESVLLLANLKVKLGALAIFAITCIKTPPVAKNKPWPVLLRKMAHLSGIKQFLLN